MLVVLLLVSSSLTLCFLSYDVDFIHERRTEDRLGALLKVKNALSLEDRSVHQLVLDAQVDKKLFLQLGYELQCRQIDARSAGLVCECMYLLYHSMSQEQRKKSFHSLREHLPCVMNAWRLVDKPQQRLAVQILRLAAKVKDDKVKKRLIYSGTAMSMIKFIPTVEDQEDRIALHGLLKDLVFRADDKDKEYLYQETSDLVLTSCFDPCLAVVESSSAVLWNWSVHAGLGDRLGQRQEFWTAMATMRSIENTKDSIAIHRHLASILGTMVASSTDVVPPLLFHQNWVVPHVVEVMQKEEDADLRRRTMRLLRCLASRDWGRDFLEKSTPCVSDLVAIVLKVLRNAKDDADTRIQSCQTASILLSAPNSQCASMFPVLETILIEIMEEMQSDDKLVLVACQTLHTCLTSSPWTRGSGCFSMSFYERVLAALQRNIATPSYHLAISRLLLQITRESASAGTVSSLVKDHVLDTIALLLSSVGPDFDESKANAVDTTVLLHDDNQSKRSLAENERLVSSLVNFCLHEDNQNKRAKVKQIILNLIPEL